MGLESASYIDELNSSNPTATDPVSQGDDHLRLIKSVLKTSFPSVDIAVNAIHASDSAPAESITAGLIWFDTSANLLKIRNEANDAWVTLAVSPVTSNSVDVNAGTVDGAIIGGSSAAAITGTTVVANTSVNIAGDGATVTGIKDEDDMSSDSAVKLATQQSIKAYVDATVTAEDLDITTDSGTIDIDLDSETLTVAGGSGLDTAASSTTVTVNVTDEGITNAKLAHMAANTVKVRDANSSGDPSDKALATTEILIGDGTGFTAAALSGDATMTNAGVVTVTKIQGEPVSSTTVANDQYLKYSSASSEWQKVNIVGDDKLTTKGDLLAYNTADSETRFGVGTNDYVLMADSSATNGFNWKQVDTDSVADNAVSLAKMAGLARGKIIYGDASGDPAALAVGTSNYVLKSDGTDIAWAAAPEGDMAANTVKVRDANSSGAPSNKALATTEILIGDGTGFTAAALSSDVTMTNAGAVTIADNAVSLAKMAGLVRGKIIYGDASGDPAALTVGGANEVLTSDGTDVSWAAASGTTINNNADNRVITGSGSANTLEGEANLTYDGADFKVNTTDFFVDGSGDGAVVNGSAMSAYDKFTCNGSGRFGYGAGTDNSSTAASSGHFYGTYKSSWTADSSARIVHQTWSEQALCLVSGNKPGDLIRFADVILMNATHVAPVVVGSSNYGAGLPTRTYTNSGTTTKMVFDDSGATWNIMLTGMGGTEKAHTAAYDTMGDA